MLSSVLKSKRAVRVNIAIIRAFVQLRESLSAHKELAFQFRKLERKVASMMKISRLSFRRSRGL